MAKKTATKTKKKVIRPPAKKSSRKPRKAGKAKPAAGAKTAKSAKNDGDWAFNLIETAPYLVSLCRDGRITYLNKTGMRWLG